MARCVVLLSLLTASAGAAAADEPKVVHRWAVLVGVDDYAYAQKLNYCGADQRAFRERLVASGFPADHVFLLDDKSEDPRYRPSQRNIERQLNVVLNLADADDLVVVAFSGHGVHLDGKSYLCPGDCTLDDAATLISLDGVYEQLKACAAGFKLVVVDACRNDPRRGGSRAMTATDGTRALARNMQELKPPEGVVLLNSCAPGEVSWEDEQFGHGVFMHFLLDALAGPGDVNADGAVSLMELQAYAGARTKTHVANRYSEIQRPFFKGDLTTEALQYALLPVQAAAAGAAPVPASVIPADAKPGELITNSIGMKLAYIPAGEFQMGAIDDDARAQDYEKPRHRVRITRPFFLGTYEVTRGQFARFVEAENYRTEAERDGEGGWGYDAATNTIEGRKPQYTWRNPGFSQTDDHPVVNVTWQDADAFCRWLSRTEGKSYSLPTDAQWEFAARGGMSTIYGCGNDPVELATIGNVADRSFLAQDLKWSIPVNFSAHFAVFEPNDGYVFTAPVGQFKPNAFGLFDMTGNAEEWCADWFDRNYYSKSPVEDPVCGVGEKERVLRGSGWTATVFSNRLSYRRPCSVPFRDDVAGFRVALSTAPAIAGVAVNAARPISAPTPTPKPVLETITNSLGMNLVLLPAGEFLMGAPDDEFDAEPDEKPQRLVRITRPFYIGQTEVTQGQWQAVMGTTPWTRDDPKYFREGDDYAAAQISWNEAQEFCRKLSIKEGKPYALPTEAQWEYACRAGTTTRFYWGDDASLSAEYEWHGRPKNAAGDEEVFAHLAARKRPNAWGLYDMTGNVSEWCEDWYYEKYYQESPPTDDPRGPEADVAARPQQLGSSLRLFRGGCWYSPPSSMRSAFRHGYGAANENNSVGFRVVRLP